MVEALILWSHTLAALLFAVLALWAAQRPSDALPGWPLVAALATSALWALTVAAFGEADAAARATEGARNLALLVLMGALHRRSGAAAPIGLGTVYGVVALVGLAGLVLQLVATAANGRVPDVETAAVLLRMMVAIAALVLAQNLYAAARGGGVQYAIAGIALLWLADLNLATVAYLTGAWPGELILVRGVAIVAAAGPFAAALQRREGAVQVSRAVAYRSLSLVAVGAYFALLALVTSGLAAIGGSYARTIQTVFVFGSTAALLTLFSSSWLRAWTRVKVAKHLFRHRYDYRAEWIRFTGTLGRPGGAMGLDERLVKAVADLTESPAGLLLVAGDGALEAAAGWNWTGNRGGADARFKRHLAAGERIVELDPLRDDGEAGEADLVPQWLLDRSDAWAVVPLLHLETLVGAIVLARPLVDRALDWEDFDLLRIAGRQVASHLAEGRARDALAQAERFDEFNRRFAFIVHDIKNLVSGITLVARNAERHADNPAFRADMVATLQDSAAKLNALLARLSQNHAGRYGSPVATNVLPLVEQVAASRRAAHPVVLRAHGPLIALVDPPRLEQVLAHLVQNAIEASGPDEPVTIALDDSAEGPVVSVIDRGCGMSAGFVRSELFRPFASSKPAGFGIGAFEARQLAEGFGGRIAVESREGEGSVFRVILPAAASHPMEQAA